MPVTRGEAQTQRTAVLQNKSHQVRAQRFQACDRRFIQSQSGDYASQLTLVAAGEAKARDCTLETITRGSPKRNALVYGLLLCRMMQSKTAVDSAAPANPGDDIVFNCPKCGAALVVAAAASGMLVNCQECKQPITVPEASLSSKDKAGASEVDAHLANLQRRLKENESQRIEITSYINQHSIQLHRWQLRLQTLEERKKELMDEILGLS